MAGSYVKIWTDILNDEWYISLNGLRRGIWLQILVLAKERGDVGVVVFKSWRSGADALGIECRTFQDFSTRAQQQNRISFEIGASGSITLTIRNYKYWQDLTVDNWRDGRYDRVSNNRGKIHTLKPNQTKPNQTIPDIESLWHEVCIDLPKIKKMTDNRTRHLNARLKDYPDLQFWKDLFIKIQASDFMKGKNNSGWVATFDFVIKSDENITKILEGKYDNRKTDGKQDRHPGHTAGERSYGQPGRIKI